MVSILYSVCFDLGTDRFRKSKIVLTDFIAVGDNIAVLLLAFLRFSHYVFTVLIIQLVELLLGVLIQLRDAFTVERKQNTIHLKGVRITEVKVFTTIRQVESATTHLGVRHSHLAVKIGLRCCKQIDLLVGMDCFAKDVKYLDGKLHFHDLLCELGIFSGLAQIGHILANQLRNIVLNIVRCRNANIELRQQSC